MSLLVTEGSSSATPPAKIKPEKIQETSFSDKNIITTETKLNNANYERNERSENDNRSIMKPTLKPNLKPLQRLDSFGYVRDEREEFDDFLSSETEEAEAATIVDTVPPETVRAVIGLSPLRATLSFRDVSKSKESPQNKDQNNESPRVLGSPRGSPRNKENKESPRSPDNKSRDNILYLAKSFKPKPLLLPKTPTSSSHNNGHTSHNGSNSHNNSHNSSHTNMKILPCKLPKPRSHKSQKRDTIEIVNFFSPNGKYYTNAITVDSRDGKGYGRRIRIPPRIERESFLSYRQGVVISLKRKRTEIMRLSQKEKSVGRLIEKFRDLSPAEYDHMIIHHFGFEKIYSISDSVLQEYNPHPNIKSPFRNKNARFAFENDGKYEKVEGEQARQVNASYSPVTTPYKSNSNAHAATFPSTVSVKALKTEHGKFTIFCCRIFIFLSSLFFVVTFFFLTFFNCATFSPFYIRTQPIRYHPVRFIFFLSGKVM